MRQVTRKGLITVAAAGGVLAARGRLCPRGLAARAAPLEFSGRAVRQHRSRCPVHVPGERVRQHRQRHRAAQPGVRQQLRNNAARSRGRTRTRPARRATAAGRTPRTAAASARATAVQAADQRRPVNVCGNSVRRRSRHGNARPGTATRRRTLGHAGHGAATTSAQRRRTHAGRSPARPGPAGHEPRTTRPASTPAEPGLGAGHPGQPARRRGARACERAVPAGGRPASSRTPVRRLGIACRLGAGCCSAGAVLYRAARVARR